MVNKEKTVSQIRSRLSQFVGYQVLDGWEIIGQFQYGISEAFGQ